MLPPADSHWTRLTWWHVPQRCWRVLQPFPSLI